ncbi:MAG: pantoate--beta-alanine ligase [Planctomycetota bacterium]|nr:pantoate--beta-alanine ligase [Planctomycetota bacterium]MDA1179859.1 pantoate--beta-alanine ligase [Planctomycetota bacterium]
MRPQLLDSSRVVFDFVRDVQFAGKKVGVVPTMGALHAGHLSLARAARATCDIVVVTIFVNPTQFAPHEDLSRYPRTLEQDIELLAGEKVDVVFAPDSAEIYPPGFSTYVQPGSVSESWEGQYRPGHFRGVTTVVLKLFQMVPAQTAVFGRKDYQQAQVIQQMVRDLNLPVAIQVEETVRDSDGLALSSRNRYLTPEQRSRALAIPAAWQHVQREFNHGITDTSILESEMRQILEDRQVDRIDYAACVHPETLERVSIAAPNTVVLLAAHVGTTRLIDNATIGNATP